MLKILNLDDTILSKSILEQFDYAKSNTPDLILQFFDISGDETSIAKSVSNTQAMVDLANSMNIRYVFGSLDVNAVYYKDPLSTCLKTQEFLIQKLCKKYTIFRVPTLLELLDLQPDYDGTPQFANFAFKFAKLDLNTVITYITLDEYVNWVMNILKFSLETNENYDLCFNRDNLKSSTVKFLQSKQKNIELKS